MAVNDLQCPNCGAPVEFKGTTQTTCSFCQSKLYFSDDGVKVSSVLSDLLEGKPAPAGVDVQQIQDLVRAGKKIEAIKLVRQQTGLGLKEAKDAVEAMERGETPDLTPAPRVIHYSGTSAATTARTTNSRWAWLGCLPTLLFIGLCAGFIMLTSQVAFRAWGPLDQVLKIINTNPQVTQVFGTPITTGPFVTGEISGGGSSSSASFGVPIYGPKQSGDLSVSGSWRKGVWDVTIWVTYTDNDGEEQTIRITQKVK